MSNFMSTILKSSSIPFRENISSDCYSKSIEVILNNNTNVDNGNMYFDNVYNTFYRLRNSILYLLVSHYV